VRSKPADNFPRAQPADGADDREAAAEALALAFADDPAWSHLLPDAATRAERLLTFFTAEIANVVPDYRQAWLTAGGGGGAIWAAPGKWRVPFLRTLRPTRSMARVFGRRLGLATWTQIRFERRHPTSAPHWYLHYIGVEPRQQGRGLGAALLAPVLERCDREGLPAYLESSNDENLPFYERHGFEVLDSFPLPLGGPPIREMWRRPRQGDSATKAPPATRLS
jgi:GNAT superfamily N-acetyltransferase